MWEFQINPSGETLGWNDNGIQTFRQNILKSLAREIIQNSIDAKQTNKRPVKVTFSLQSMPRDNVPGVEELKDRLENILRSDAKNEGESHLSEIKEAYDCISKSTLNVLTIIDSNTSGMPYFDENTRSPLFRYIKASGSSGGDQNRAGSHGLGKAAPLATSPLRTIYVSTMWQADDGSIRTCYQGRTRLMSLTTEKGISSGTGYWGTANFKPFTKLDNELFTWLERDVAGTTIAVPGFRVNNKEWSAILAGFVVSEFFMAIHRGSLEVYIQDNVRKPKPQHYELNAQTINNKNKYFNNRFFKEEIQNYLNKEDTALEDAAYYYRCVQPEADKIIVEEFEIQNLGPVKLRLLVSDGAPRKLCLVRRDMKITDNLRTTGGMWAPGHVPPKIKDFCGIVEILSPEGEKIIRSMEPPQHNDLSSDNMPEQRRAAGIIIYRELSKKLRALIEKHASAEISQNRVVSELSEYFYDDTEIDANAPTVTQETDPNGRLKVALAPLKPIKINPTPKVTTENGDDGDEGGAGNDEGAGGGGTSGHGPGSGNGTQGKGPQKEIDQNIKLRKQRIWKSNDIYKFTLTTDQPFSGKISLFEVGMIGYEKAYILSSSVGKVEKDGRLSITEKDFADNMLKCDVSLRATPKGGLTLLASTD